MERQPHRRPQQSHRAQPQRPAQRPPQRRPVQPGRPSRPGPYRRRQRRSKKPIILGVVVILLLIVIVVLISGKDKSSDRIEPNVEPVTLVSDQVETVANTETQNATNNFSQVAYDANGVKITLTGYKRDELVGDEIEYLFENNSSVPVMFGVGNAYVDGWQIATLGGNTLPAGTKANGTIYISKANLDESGISKVTNLTLKECNLWNDETYSLIDSFDITLNLG